MIFNHGNRCGIRLALVRTRREAETTELPTLRIRLLCRLNDGC